MCRIPTHTRKLLCGVSPLIHTHSHVPYPHWHTHTYIWRIPTYTRTLTCAVSPLTHKRENNILWKKLCFFYNVAHEVRITHSDVTHSDVGLLPTDTQERVARSPDTHVYPPRVHTHTCHRMREDRTWVLTWALESKKHKWVIKKNQEKWRGAREEIGGEDESVDVMCVCFVLSFLLVHVCVYICVRLYIYTYVCIYVYVYIYIYTHMAMYICIYIHMHMYIQIYVWIYLYTHWQGRCIRYRCNVSYPLISSLST